MKILHLSYHCCIRNLKEGFTLQDAGHENAYLCSYIANDEYRYDLPMLSFWPLEEGPFDKLKHFKGFDIIHVHYEPNWGCFLSNTKDYFPNTPVIFDAHDLDMIKFGVDKCGEVSRDMEKKVFKECDAFIYPCETYKREANKLFNINGKPEAVIYSKVFPRIAEIKPMPRIGGIAYQGGIAFNERNKFKDLRYLAEWFTESDIPFHIHSASINSLKEYQQTGALLYAPQPYFKLMRSLTRYDWGLCAGPFEDEENHWHSAMPNKLFEYAACGLPVLTWHESEIADYVREHKIGIVLDDIKDIYARYEEHIEIRESLRNRRYEFTMKTELPKIEQLYKAVLNV